MGRLTKVHLPDEIAAAVEKARLTSESALLEIITRLIAERDEARSSAATFTHDAEGGNLYYFAPALRHPPPYTTQRHVEAIIDIAPDGSLAGVEMIDDMPPPFREPSQCD